MSVAEPPANAVATLLREQRYRRHFLHADAKQAVTVIVVISIGFLMTARNDVLLLRGSPMLGLMLALKAVYLVITVVCIVMLRRGTWPRQHDRAYALWGFAIASLAAHGGTTRLSVGEVQAPLFAHGALLCALYFAQRGPFWIRASSSGIVTIISLFLVWNPQAMLTPAARTSATIGLLALNAVGIVSARAFEEQRRRRFEAERQERQARQQLTVKMRELAIEKERAEAMSRARTLFLATMSHEFRTPMNAVLGFSELLLDSHLDGKQHEYVFTIRESARGLLGLLNDVLDFAKIDADKLSLAAAPFDLRALAASVVAMMEPAATARSVQISLEFSQDAPVFVLGDDMRLRQVLLNLLSNATKFTDRGQVRLVISARKLAENEHEVAFRVEDTGMGMKPDVVARLFQPFEQGDHGITRRHGGTGLGLAISRRIVQAMGSDIHVESEVGRGSVFSFAVTLQDADPIAQRSSQPLAGDQVPLSILVVDDHPINRRVATAMLERLGYTTDLAQDGPAAIDALSNKAYDIVFMDLHMPGMSGIEATMRIREKLEGKPLPHIVAMTASVFEEDREACRQAGMREFVGKPIDIAQLDAVLSRVSSQRAKVASTSPGPANLDPEPLEKLRQLEQFGEPGFVVGLCRDFLADTPERIERMRRALDVRNAKEIEREAHSLKSSSGSLGAMEMSALCARIEKAAHTGDLADVRPWVDALSAALARVEPALAREVARIGA